MKIDQLPEVLKQQLEQRGSFELESPLVPKVERNESGELVIYEKDYAYRRNEWLRNHIYRLFIATGCDASDAKKILRSVEGEIESILLDTPLQMMLYGRSGLITNSNSD